MVPWIISTIAYPWILADSTTIMWQSQSLCHPALINEFKTQHDKAAEVIVWLYKRMEVIIKVD